MPEKTSHRLILTHSVLVGATPLIPIPVLDDLAKSYLQRRMIRELGELRGQLFDSPSTKTLADDSGEGCLRGCLSGAVMYPLKKLFRKVFLFLEWKRAIDLVSRTYHRGYLVDHALSRGWAGPSSGRTAGEVRRAVDDVCRLSPIKPVELAVKVTFGQSKAVVRDAARILQESFRRLVNKASHDRIDEVARAIEAVGPEEERQIEGLVTRLQAAIEEIPKEHFRRLEDELAARLGVHPPT